MVSAEQWLAEADAMLPAMTMTTKELQALVAKARGGRVVRTPFVDSAELDLSLIHI